MMDKIKVVFLATPDIAIKSFEFFINSNDYEVLALVTQAPKAKNRGHKIVENNIVKIAKSNSIAVFEPEKISKDEDAIKSLKQMNPDFFVTFAFGQILSQEVIDIPKIATINLHASLLPKYRGANPISEVIADGCAKTGITTMKTVLALDAGDICMQEEIEIPVCMNVIELMEEISLKSPNLLDKTLKGLFNKTITPFAQDESKATFTKKIKKEEKLVDFNTDAVVLHNKIRAMYKINTNHMVFQGKIIKILKTMPSIVTANPAQVVEIAKDKIVVGCKTGSIEIYTVKPEGKGEMNAADWARGARIKIGDYIK